MFGKLYVEITTACNLNCPFCPRTLRPSALISRERFARIIDRLKGRGRLLHLHVKGEPLLHPELGSLLAIAAEAGFEVALATNGTLLEKAAETLLAAPNLRKLSVSLHSQATDDTVRRPGSGADLAAPDAGDRVTNRPGDPDGDLDRYWNNVSAFLDRHREQPRFPVSLRLWNRRDGRLPPEAAPLWRLLAARYPRLGSWESPDAWPADNRLDAKVFLNGAELFDWPDPALPEGPAEGTCLGLRDQLAVLVDGTVVPCCLDGEGRLALGNLFETDLDGILASPRARAIREGFERGRLVEDLCRRCGFRRRFD